MEEGEVLRQFLHRRDSRDKDNPAFPWRPRAARRIQLALDQEARTVKQTVQRAHRRAGMTWYCTKNDLWVRIIVHFSLLVSLFSDLKSHPACRRSHARP